MSGITEFNQAKASSVLVLLDGLDKVDEEFTSKFADEFYFHLSKGENVKSFFDKSGKSNTVGFLITSRREYGFPITAAHLSEFLTGSLALYETFPAPYEVERPKVTLESDILEQIDQVCEQRALSGGKELLRGGLIASQLYRKRKEARNQINSYTVPILGTVNRAFAEWKDWHTKSEEHRDAAALAGIFASLIVLLLRNIRILIIHIRKLLAEVLTYRSVLSPRRRDDVFRKKRETPQIFVFSNAFIPTFQTQRRVQRLQISI